MPRGDILAHEIVPPGNYPIISGEITLGNGCTVQGIQVDGAGSLDDCIQGTNINNAFIDNCILRDYPGDAVQFIDCGGTLSVTDSTIGASPNQGIELDDNSVNVEIAIIGDLFEDDAVLTPNEAVGIDATGTTQLSLSFHNNRTTSPAAATGWEGGLRLTGSGTSLVTANALNNDLAGCRDDGLDLNAGSTLALPMNAPNFTLIASGNTITGVLDNGITMDAINTAISVLTAQNNLCTGNGGDGIQLDTSNTATLSAITTKNTCNTNDQAFVAAAADGSALNIAARMSLLNGNTNDDATFTSNGTSTMGLDITGNTADQLVLTQNAGTTMNVERLDAGNGGPLDAANTITTLTINGTPTPQMPGFCGL